MSKLNKIDLSELRHDIMTIYLKYIESLNVPVNDIMELLRYTICISLGLNTKPTRSTVEQYSPELIKEFSCIFDKYNIKNQKIEYRQGILEMCVHTISFTLKKAGYIHE